MARLIVWIILITIVARMIWRFMYAIFDGAGMLKDSDDRQRAAVRLVRDPVCGVFVSPTQALTIGSGSSTRYFCSEKCRREWSHR
jgi:YHS domain-containing protein